ncbi:unnamed protein product [Orchesella dallaii]|uniref:Uncharacterized protein n=1 Tax=Orchesella dallaii TaxID=48710 RepID=A0ABP1S0C1_9HEXA
MLDICIIKVNRLLQQVLDSKRCTALSQIIGFCKDLYTSKNWERLASEMFHVSRIHFLKHIQKYIRVLNKSSDMKTVRILESMSMAYPIDSTVDRSLIIVPNCFGLLKEMILRVISTKVKFTYANAKIVIGHLSAMDWTTADSEEVRKLLYVVYYSFITADVKVKANVKTLLYMNAIPVIDELRIHHLKNEYLEG